MRLSRPPPVRLVAATRRLVQAVCDEVLADPDTGCQVAMAAHELLENLAKHASSGAMEFEVTLVRRDGQDYVRIRTRNRATPTQLSDLSATLRAVETSVDPYRTYVQFLHRSATRVDGSGLGLARIRAEADMKITHSICGDEVTLFAELPVESRRTA